MTCCCQEPCIGVSLSEARRAPQHRHWPLVMAVTPLSWSVVVSASSGYDVCPADRVRYHMHELICMCRAGAYAGSICGALGRSTERNERKGTRRRDWLSLLVALKYVAVWRPVPQSLITQVWRRGNGLWRPTRRKPYRSCLRLFICLRETQDPRGKL